MNCRHTTMIISSTAVEASLTTSQIHTVYTDLSYNALLLVVQVKRICIQIGQLMMFVHT